MGEKLLPCPFCEREVRIRICDDEGNHRPASYADDPWSGLGFILVHEREEETACPIATHEGEDVGSSIYDTEADAIEAWNTRARDPLAEQMAEALGSISDRWPNDARSSGTETGDIARAALAAWEGRGKP